MRVDQPGQERLLAEIDNFTRIFFFDLIKFANVDDAICGNHDGGVPDRWSIHRHDGPRTNNHSPFTTFRHSAINRLQASWQSNGTVAASLCEACASPTGPRLQTRAWSYAGSNFCLGNFVDAIAPSPSRFHRIVRRHPPSVRQKPATRSSICESEIFPATRYIPDCRSNVSRNGVVCSLPFFHAA